MTARMTAAALLVTVSLIGAGCAAASLPESGGQGPSAATGVPSPAGPMTAAPGTAASGTVATPAAPTAT
ncbi:MAG: hypothetical protein WCK58_18475, partial [Chloroflexota bacterium]